MKLRIYVLKKKQLIIAAIILAAIILLVALLLTLRAKETVKIIGNTYTFNDEDVDGDGKYDSITFKAGKDASEYETEIITSSGKIYTLQSDPAIRSLGKINSRWPMNILVKDLDNDKLKEIVLQSSDDKGPILHIFKFEGSEFKRLFSGRYSVFSNFKVPNETSNLILLGNMNENTLNYKYFMIKNGRFSGYTAIENLTLGKDVFTELLSYMEEKDVEAFNNACSSKYSEEVAKADFLDAIIDDVKYSKNNVPTEFSYYLRTNTNETEDSKPLVYRIKMKLLKNNSEKPEYEVSDISKIK